MFKNGVEYPRDDVGEFIEVQGPAIDIVDGEPAKITIQSPDGEITGWAHGHLAEAARQLRTVGQYIVRVYHCGGGFYPDNRVVGWRKTPDEHFVYHPQLVHEILQYFTYEHLPSPLCETSKYFADLAQIVAVGPNNPETLMALRKLLEAKDCAVRAQLGNR